MSTDLTSTKIKNTFNQLLHVDGGVTSTPKTVYDGDGTATSVKISTSGLQVNNSEVLTDADIGNSIQPYDPELIQEIQDNADSAAASATASANSATNAGISASQASTSASNAATSATNAANSATQAANSAASAAAIVTGVASNRPSIRPSLLLDFQYTKQLDPRITFSRASTGTYYDGKTVANAEENLLTYSQEFDNAAWAKFASSVTSNAITAPDGTATADTINEGSTTSAHLINQTYAIAANTQYVFSCYAKNIDGVYVCLSLRGASSNIAAAEFNLSTGALSKTYAIGTGFVVNNTSITEFPAGSGWYRCVLIATVGATVSSIAQYIGMSDGSAFTASGLPSYTGTNRSIYIWGAQLEQRSTVTAYTPTTTARITNYIPVLQTAVSNDARFDHDPVTGESKGLLIEEQRTNLVTYSEQFDNAAWTKTRSSIVANTTVAPDGTLTGDKLVENTDNNTHRLDVSFTWVSGTTYTNTLYAKAGERTTFRIQLPTAAFTSVFADFNLTAGTVTPVSGVTASITNVGNGWYRCSVSGTATASTTASILNALLIGTDASYQGNGYSGIYIWGAQLEAGSFPTSYIPTVASQVTRSADSASMTGSNFSSWYRADEGTLYAEAIPNWSGSATATGVGTKGIVSTNNSATAGFDGYSLYLTGASTSSVRFVHREGAATISAVVNDGYIIAGKTYKSVGAYKNAEISASNNGSAVSTATDTVYGLNTQNQLLIGLTDVGGTPPYDFSGTIKRIAYYPKRLSNTELQGLTS